MLKNLQSITTWRFHAIFLVIAIVSSGCTALQPFPNVARGGDTVALAVGSPDDMTRSNTLALFVSDVDSSIVDITANIRSIFKLYADPASVIYQGVGSTTGSLVESSGHDPWITVVAIDLPEGLTVGNGHIEFTTTAVYPDIGSHINDVNVPVEIIAGTGTASTFPYEFGIGSSQTGNLTALEALPMAVFGPDYPSPSCPCPTYGAIEVKVNVQTNLGLVTDDFMRIIPSNLTMFTGSGINTVHGIAPNGQDLTIIFTSNTGKLQYQEARFSLVLHAAVSFTGTPTITSVKYFDVNGNEVSGPVSDYIAAIK